MGAGPSLLFAVATYADDLWKGACALEAAGGMDGRVRKPNCRPVTGMEIRGSRQAALRGAPKPRVANRVRSACAWRPGARGHSPKGLRCGPARRDFQPLGNLATGFRVTRRARASGGPGVAPAPTLALPIEPFGVLRDAGGSPRGGQRVAEGRGACRGRGACSGCGQPGFPPSAQQVQHFGNRSGPGHIVCDWAMLTGSL